MRASALLGVALAACGATPVPLWLRPLPSPAATVLVVVSQQDPALEAVVAGFAGGLEASIAAYSLSPSLDDAALRRLAGRFSPRLVFALGAAAAHAVSRLLPETPLLFAEVEEQGDAPLGGRAKVMGIEAATSPAVDLVQFKMVLPSLHSVLALVAPGEARGRVEEARRAARRLGIALSVVVAASAAEVEAARRADASLAEAVWILSATCRFPPDVVALLEHEDGRDSLPRVVSLAGRGRRLKALVTVAPDRTALGAQAAAMARRFLEGALPESLGVQPAIGSRLLVDGEATLSLGLLLPEGIAAQLADLAGEP
jgi:ABC-type uncharacterized transport system substrate-binding protein